MNLRPRDRIAIAVVVFAVLVGAYYLLALKPEQQKVQALDAKIATQKQTLAQAQQDYATGRAALASLKADSAEWTALHVAVPAQSDIPGLLRILERNATAVHVNMQTISLTGGSGAPAATGTTAGSASASAGATAATGVPVQLTFSGGYAALNNLVHRLDSLVVLSGNKVRATGPLMSIGSVTLSGSGNLTVQLTATIYQLSAAAGAAGATTGG
jgi:Type II secretion system (T2SS), protein M